MTIPGLVIGIVLFFVALVGVVYPFVQEQRNSSRATVEAQKKRDELLTSYERVLATIRDLDEDHQTGKIDPDTYQREREYWTEQGIVLLQKLDPDSDDPVADVPVVDEPMVSDADAALDDAIEKAIANYRGVKA